ncbi:MAG TPA: site-specific integrase [Tepidisphaeraceae bacterium]|jgi:integrase
MTRSPTPVIVAVPGKHGTSYRAIVERPRRGGVRQPQLTKTFSEVKGGRAAAEAWWHEQVRRRDGGPWSSEAELDLATVLELHLARRQASGEMSSGTAANRRSLIAHTYGDLLALPVAQITAFDLERCQAQRQRDGIAGATRELAYVALSAVFRELNLPDNPITHVRRPKNDTLPGDRWTAAEAASFLAAETGRRELALWALMLRAGLRKGEALALAWRDVRFRDRLIHVDRTLTLRLNAANHLVETLGDRAKTRESVRDIPLPQDLSAILAAHKLRMKAEADLLGLPWHEDRFVLPADDGDHFLPSYKLYRRLAAALARTGARPLGGCHGFRRTFAALALEHGVPLPYVMEWMGHRDVETTMRYAKTNPQEHQRQAAQLAAALALPHFVTDFVTADARRGAPDDETGE